MSVREVPTREWREFLHDFSHAHRAWLATVDSDAPDTFDQIGSIERPLQSVDPAVENNRVVGIAIRLQQDSDVLDAVRIEKPVSVRVDETHEGATRGLEIVDHHGDRTRLRFHSAPPPAEMLDGIAPGELLTP